MHRPSIHFECYQQAGKTALDKKLYCSYNIIMSGFKFSWDKKKASLNERKHNVSFDEAKTVFFDECAKIIDDPDHSQDEERFIILGLSSSARLLVVCHCCHDADHVIRLISARRATQYESKQYRGFLS